MLLLRRAISNSSTQKVMCKQKNSHPYFYFSKLFFILGSITEINVEFYHYLD